MPIPPELRNLVNQINQELDQIEQETQEALQILRSLLNRFPSNAVLTQFFGAVSNFQFFVSVQRRKLEDIITQASTPNADGEQLIQQVGEDLGASLGEVLEAKMNLANIKRRLENLR